MNAIKPIAAPDAAARLATIVAILDAASFVANATAEGAASSIVGDRTLADLLEHGYRLSQELKRDIDESA